MSSKITLHHGNCLEVMPQLEDSSIDCIIADLPYGSTQCAWDVIIPLDSMWEQIRRVTKPRANTILFANMPFAAQLIVSNISQHKYSLVWDKKFAGNFSTAKYRPMQVFELIHVFYDKVGTYNPQMIPRDVPITSGKRTNPRWRTGTDIVETYNAAKKVYTEKYPTAIIHIPRTPGKKALHPTEKPVKLLEYLVQTFTNESDTVLDFCMGSGTTGIACKSLNRNFIGIELDQKYFEVAHAQILGK